MMKLKVSLAGIFGVLLVFGLVLAGCSDDGGNGDPKVVTYKSADSSGNTYTLTITDNTSYKLEVTATGQPTKTSSGTASISGGSITLTPSGSATTFTITVSGEGMTGMTGTITFDGGETEAAPASLTPQLGPITEGTTGRSEIKVTGAVLKGETIPDGTYSSADSNNFEGSVSNGTWTLTLNTPNDSQVMSLTDLNNDDGNQVKIFGKTAGEYQLSSTDSSAKYCIVSRFKHSKDGQDYRVERIEAVTNHSTYYDGSSIAYVYVSKDATLTRDAKSYTKDGGDVSRSYSAISLSLKKGWNLVQTDEHYTQPDPWSYTIKIAANDVPWSGRLQN